ncbi:MAG: CinA family nicotinamide mononucleotide deamidase-related protein [SAR324 cluster bacterium]|nr:CinA family nicotinamide mononucleotide deamidase-related protein [SAR324 cluster bacterium]
MDIEVICTGDEVLTGKIINSNFSYITQKLEDFGLSVKRGVTVGDDREELLRAFQLAGERADVVIVNGGLGPTVDDLSQEIAAKAAGVELELNEDWLHRMREYFSARGRTMPENNSKQAMLPKGAEMVDNPIGTACGFGVSIGKAVFYFTPGVPRELHRMLEHELIPRMLKKSGIQEVIVLKRFHSYGLGESHVDQLLSGLVEMVPDGSLKLGFRAHYPQLETKLTIRAASMDEARAKLAPVEDELRSRLGNFILAEDDETLEGVLRELLLKDQASLAVVEDFTGGQIAGRLAPLPDAGEFLLRGTVAPSPRSKMDIFAVDGENTLGDWEFGIGLGELLAQRSREGAGATYGLAALCQLSEGDGRIAGNMNSNIVVAIASREGIVHRRSRLAGNRDWIRLGTVELALDCLRRHLQGLPIQEKTDFERPPPR